MLLEELFRQEHRNRLSVCSKICYAIGGAPYQITGCALGFFLQIYLLDVAQLDPFYASIILFVGRAWDAITDPTVGFLVSRSPWTRFGRMLPWIVLSTPLAVISYFLIWYVPPFENGKVIWYLVFYCIFQTLQTCFHVPYSALTMFISSEQKDRDSATAYRMTVEVLGTVLGTAIQGQIVGMANAPCLPGPHDIVTNLSNSSVSFGLNNSEPVISLDHTKTAYMIASGVICIIYVLCAIVVFFGVRDRSISEMHPSSCVFTLTLCCTEGLPFCKTMLTCNIQPRMEFTSTSESFVYLCVETKTAVKPGFKCLFPSQLSATLAIPFWQWFLTRFGKKTAVFTGSLSVVPFMILVVCVKSNLIVTYIVSFAAGVGVAAAFLLPWSMLPDVVDDFQVQNPNSTGHEALFYSFYVFFTKFASGVSLGISTLSLDFAGYISRGCSQPEEVDITLKVLVSAAPIALIMIGLIILYSYPITEERRQGNRKLLQEQRDNEADSDTDSTEMANVV
uniref:MFSD2 lysolipid transporter A, lysophospholipid b n=1 Tax=Sander lucioperca TaxID=283035 RepID=A0A8D0AEZ0_SANLU